MTSGTREITTACLGCAVVLLGAACAASDDAPGRSGRNAVVDANPGVSPAGAGTAGATAFMPSAAGASAQSPSGPSDGAAGCGPDRDCTSTGFGAAGAEGGLGGAGTAGGAAGGGLDPQQPTCFEFRNHGQPVAGDTTKYSILPGEQYVCNHFHVPWNEPAEMVGWQTLFDNRQVLHHWLLYSVPAGPADGTFEPCIGTHLLQDAQLVAGWAVGGNDVDMPEDVGLRMPGPDRTFLLEWHFYNSTSAVQVDGSAASICVLPAGTRTHTAGLTWLGTENFNGPLGMPPGQVSDFGGTCINDSGAPITIFRLWPHMHQWGRHMTSVVHRASGATEEVFSMPFDFNFQVSYPANVTLMPGESIRSTCRFNNQSLGPVAFGPSSDQEMCYQFAFSYPAGALDNGVLSLVGATNTCW